MKNLYPLFVLLFVLAINNCSDAQNTQNLELGEPVETQKPNADYDPAFEGQTRAPGVKTKTELQINIIADNIGKPWGLTHLPNGDLLVTDKSGFMQIFDTDGRLKSKVEGFPKVVDNRQGGMLDVTLDPNFENNRMIFWTFSEPYEDGNLTSAAKGRLSDDNTKIENPQVIYRAIPAYDGGLHFGGRIIFDKNENIFVSTGERSDLVTRPNAQKLNTAHGKILRITKDGDPVSNNPFIEDDNVLPEIYSYGHRNVQGLALHPVTGELWNSEFGPRGGDEINFIQPGKDYGWPTITYGLEYSGKIVGEGITQHEGMEQPAYYWDPSPSPSGITFYNGEIGEWENNLFLGALSDQHIIRLVIDGHKVIAEEKLLENEGERFRDIHQGGDGKLYAITDSGKIYKIEKK